MNTASHTSLALVSKRGAPAEAILRGSGISNQGLRVRVLQEQPKGKDGPIEGPFVILDVGKNRHSQALAPLVNQVTDSQTVLQIIRKEHPACVNAVNANILVLDTDQSLTASASEAEHPVSDPDRE